MVKKKQPAQPASEKNTKMKFCPHCGEKIRAEAEICPKCGMRVKEAPEKKSPALAAVLSFIMTGLGQVYNGQISKGIAFFIVGVLTILSIFILVGIVLAPVFWAYNIYDAYDSAKKVNAAE